MSIQSPKDFENKYNKSIAKYIVKMYYSEENNDIDEFLLDVKDYVNFLSNKKNSAYLVFPDPKDVSKFINYVYNFNILCINGYVSGIEKKTCHDVLSYFDNVNSGDVVICVFDASPEADVTFECISNHLIYDRNCKVIRMPFGVSAFSPSKTDDYTFEITLHELLKKI